MKLNILKCAALAAVATAFTACHDVDDNDRLVYVKPSIPDTPETEVRRVLIEDFTGQACINCPSATDEIHSLQSVYGSNVVAVGIHSGRFSKKAPTYKSPYPLWTKLGDTYYNYWNISSQPHGIINRIGGEQLYQQWAQLVAAYIQQPAGLHIDVNNVYDASTNTLRLNAVLKALRGNNISGKLQLWVIQNGINGLQLFPGNRRENAYEHNHVFRFAVNGDWGEDVSIESDQEKTVSYDVNLTAEYEKMKAENADAPAFVPENMSVVAFVYNDGGVENVIQVPFIQQSQQ